MLVTNWQVYVPRFMDSGPSSMMFGLVGLYCASSGSEQGAEERLLG
jgi:hypothetical protein